MEGAKLNLHLSFAVDLIVRDYASYFKNDFRKLSVEQSLLTWLREHCRSLKKENTQGKFDILEQINANNNNKSIAIKPKIMQVASHEGVSVKRDSVCTRTLSEFVPFSGKSNKTQVFLSPTCDKLICHM